MAETQMKFTDEDIRSLLRHAAEHEHGDKFAVERVSLEYTDAQQPGQIPHWAATVTLKSKPIPMTSQSIMDVMTGKQRQ